MHCLQQEREMERFNDGTIAGWREIFSVINSVFLVHFPRGRNTHMRSFKHESSYV